ncbi:unnamed protein product [Prorocentrum cordatum]|uniref:Mitochondrial inner membrane protease ATP23 n=1 Tax=Prorocentrum cordatum TaxID=2364126 RepID=A0ABN9UYZ6_9DINO|nr:unnamed protein product [Polarella glacialis]
MAGAQELLRDLYAFCNALLFRGELAVDSVAFLCGAGARPALEADGAEAAFSAEFSDGLAGAVLRVDFSWERCQAWPVTRLASVLLHELVHAWHDSVAWAPPAQLAEAHSGAFLGKCAQLQGLCEAEGLPFFPDVFTESWALLALEDLSARHCLGSPAARRRPRRGRGCWSGSPRCGAACWETSRPAGSGRRPRSPRSST